LPPCGILWLANPFVAALVAIAVGLRSMPQVSVSTYVLVFISCIVLVRVLVAGVVSFAIWHSVWIAKRAVKSFKPEVVVGFSWGSAVAAKLCADGGWHGPVVLLAPTLSAVSAVSLRRIPRVPDDAKVFQAEHDAFVPHSQAKALEDMGVHVQICRGDDHVLCNPTTISAIADCLRRCSFASSAE